KKKEKVMAKQREQFIEGAVDRGIDEDKAEEVFDLMAQFASYGFNKSHSAAYAKIAVQTAYLKNYHPVEFMAALMTCDRDNNDKIVGFLNEAQEMGIEVLPPDVNESALNFTVTDGKIRFGLGAVKGVGAGVVESIVEAREDGGDFESLYDFCERVDLEEVTTATVEALVQCGAFDSIGPEGPSSFIGDIGQSRAKMFEAADQAVDRGKQAQHDAEVGQNSIFGVMDEDEREDVLEETYPDADPWPDRELLEHERELLGFYVTGHPLDSYESALEMFDRTTLEDVSEGNGVSDGQRVTVAGVITELSEQPINNGDGRMAFISLEDRSGRVEVLAFSNAFESHEETFKGNEPIRLRGEVMEEGEGEARSWKIRADEAKPLGEVRRDEVGEVRLELGASELGNGELEELERLLQRHPGPCEMRLTVSVPADGGRGRAELPLSGYSIEPNNDLMRALDRLIGREAVRFSS
ncbi:MAG: OB-fold nucleic acid binding domain-containing protein, partial [Bradymonadaceae bacterium]